MPFTDTLGCVCFTLRYQMAVHIQHEMNASHDSQCQETNRCKETTWSSVSFQMDVCFF
jgi:hypothetical protein